MVHTRRIVNSPARLLLSVVSVFALAGPAEAGGPRWIDVNNSEEPARYITGMLEWDPDGAAGSEGTVLVVGTDQATNAGGFQNAADRAWAFRFNGVDWAPLGRTSAFTFPAPARDFADFGGQLHAAAGSVLRYDGSEWSVIGTPNAGGSVTEIIAWNGGLFAAGTFSSIDGTQANNIARWDGVQWAALGDGVTGTSGAAGTVVQDLEVFQNSVVASGVFTSAGGTACTGIAAWNGAAWTVFAGDITSATPLVVNTLSASPDGTRLYVGGNFNAVGGAAAGFCVAREAGGWVTLPGLTAMPDAIRAMSAGVYAASNAFAFDSANWRGLRRLESSAWGPVVETSTSAVSNGILGLAEYRTVVITARSTGSNLQFGTIRSIAEGAITRLGVNTIGFNTSFLRVTEGLVFAEPFSSNWTRNGLARGLMLWNGSEFIQYLPELKARSVTAVLQEGEDLYLAGDFAPGNIAGARRIAARIGGVWTSLDSGIPYSASTNEDYLVNAIARFQGVLRLGLIRYDTAASSGARFDASIWTRVGDSWESSPNDPVTRSVIFGGQITPLNHAFMTNASFGFKHFVPFNSRLFLGGAYALASLNGVPIPNVASPIIEPLERTPSGWAPVLKALSAGLFSANDNATYGGIWDMQVINGELFAVGCAVNFAPPRTFSGHMKWTPAGWDAPDTRATAAPNQGFHANSATFPFPLPRKIVARNGLQYIVGSFSGPANPLPASPSLAAGVWSAGAYNGEGWVGLSWRNPSSGQLAQGLTSSNGTSVSDAFSMIEHDGKLLILGTFARAGGLSSPNIAVFDPGDPPVFQTTDPVTIPACPSASLSIAAPAVTFAEADQWRHYQWFRNGLPMVEGSATPSGFGVYTGTQTPTLVISNPQPSDSQSVLCKVTTIGGVVYSPAITPRILPDVSASPNGVVDTPDLVFFLGRFGEAATAGSQAARVDFNLDGVVNTPDLAAFLGRFGIACPN